MATDMVILEKKEDGTVVSLVKNEIEELLIIKLQSRRTFVLVFGAHLSKENKNHTRVSIYLYMWLDFSMGLISLFRTKIVCVGLIGRNWNKLTVCKMVEERQVIQ